MNIIRIPTRYKKQLSRLTKDERSEVLFGLFDLATGENLQLFDTPAGDLLELIWGDCLQMEKKNKGFDPDSVGIMVAGDPHTVVYSSVVKGSVVKDTLIEREEIIGYLNQVTGKKFRATTDSTIKSINARLKDGYTVDDFKQVIKTKYTEWKGTKYAKYLSPDTLFRPSHFEKYLNQTNEMSSDDMVSEFRKLSPSEFRQKYGLQEQIRVGDLIAE